MKSFDLSGRLAKSTADTAFSVGMAYPRSPHVPSCHGKGHSLGLGKGCQRGEGGVDKWEDLEGGNGKPGGGFHPTPGLGVELGSVLPSPWEMAKKKRPKNTCPGKIWNGVGIEPSSCNNLLSLVIRTIVTTLAIKRYLEKLLSGE